MYALVPIIHNVRKSHEKDVNRITKCTSDCGICALVVYLSLLENAWVGIIQPESIAAGQQWLQSIVSTPNRTPW
jgi:hypothetical protein